MCDWKRYVRDRLALPGVKEPLENEIIEEVASQLEDCYLADVDAAIESDIKTIKRILKMADLFPGGPEFDQIFDEIRDMFLQEIDYDREADLTELVTRNSMIGVEKAKTPMN